MAEANLVLHCGARTVSEEQLRAAPCPSPEGRWRPVPHAVVLDHARRALTDAGYEVEHLQLGLARNDSRFFGTLTLRSALAEGVSLAVGVRSSTDKSISLQWACGSRVFVCDNLAFRSEQIISRKHTINGVLRYQEAISRAVSGLAEFQGAERERIRQMQGRAIGIDHAEAMLLRLYHDEGILSPRTLPLALKELRQPSFPGFEEMNAWRLYNAVTFAVGSKARSNPQAHAAMTIRLGALLEGQAQNGFVPAGAK